jgi:hypothetical protein
MKNLLLALTLCLMPALVHASLVTFGFTGQIADCFICSAPLETNIFSGQYSFDSAGVDLNSNENQGFYIFAGYSGFVQVGDMIAEWTDLTIGIGDNRLAAIPGFRSDTYTIVGGNGTFIFSLQGCNGDIFAGDDLPLSPLSLLAFRPNCAIDYEAVMHNVGSIREGFGNLTSLYVVPEPPAWLLGVLSLLMLGLCSTLPAPSKLLRQN